MTISTVFHSLPQLIPQSTVLHHSCSLPVREGNCGGDCDGGFPQSTVPQSKGREMQIERTLKYMIIQIHPDASPTMPEIKSNFLTGDGVLVAFSADGYYADREMAEAVAQALSEAHPLLDTLVVEVLSLRGKSAKGAA